MCGFAGYIRTSSLASEKEHQAALLAMNDALIPRGPDAYGTWVDAQAGVALGHRRLSILDLSPTGAQPMASASGRFIVSFNGEIYNFPEIRCELEAAGVAFRGRSDTEVLLE